MTVWRRTLVLDVVFVGLACGSAAGQGYLLRLDSRVQRVSYRGVSADSIPAGEAVTSPTGGLQTADGFAVRCPVGGPYCFFFRPGPALRAAPLVTSADLTLWGLGIGGLSVRVNGRVGLDLGNTDIWPGTEPEVQLNEAYAMYAHRAFAARLGRQLLADRLGVVGLDGGRVTASSGRRGFDAELYAGLGIARATALPVSSPVLNPLDDFQPRRRQILAGAAIGWSSRHADVRLHYQREIDRDTRNFASERAALSLDFRVVQRWALAAGADYDLANTWFGNADVEVRYIAPSITAAAGLRQYRPHFDLWTIWGAFSPVPYHAAHGAVWVRPARELELRARWERYAFSESEAQTPLVDVDDDGWRLGVGVSYSPTSALTLDAGYREEYGPGGASHGFEGGISFVPAAGLALTAYGSILERPLEFRFEEASVAGFGLDAEWSPTDRLRLALGAARYAEDRERPDAAAFDWDQTRFHARVSLLLRSDVDALRLPPAIRARPPAGSR